MFDQIIGQNCL